MVADAPSDQNLNAKSASDSSQAGAQNFAGGGTISLGHDVEIYAGRPLPDYASPSTQAFEAKDRRHPGDQIAIVCPRENIPRVTSLGSYRNLKNPHLVRLVESGVVDWKTDGRQRFVLVFDKPAGKRMQTSWDTQPYHFSEDRIVAAFIQPMLSVLTDLKNADMVHGAINTQNIYIGGGQGTETVMLGECLSSAPSTRQHAFFESIERGMAHPHARGQGTIKDDLYALGMCVALMVRGDNMLAGKTERAIVEGKVENGSYGIVIGRERMPNGIAEFLRGVLSDDDGQRWGLEDALRWIEGRRSSPKQPLATVHAARPFIFRDHKYWDLRSISYAFSLHPADAMAAIDKDQFDLWIKRNFEDKDLDSRLAKIWEREKNANSEKLLTSIAMNLDPVGPVRYKGIAAFPTGFGNALGSAMAAGDDIQYYAEMVQQQMFTAWVQLRFDAIPDASNIITTYEKCRTFLTQKMAGYGIERVLYILSKECPCMSPLLKDYFVLGPSSLLSALEKISNSPNRSDNVFDRHIIAFISVREPKMIDPHLGQVVSNERGNQVVGILRTLAAIQRRFSMPAMPGLSKWMVSLITPAVNRFNDRELRAEVTKQLAKAEASGNLQSILDLVDDPRLVQDDQVRFQMARREYARLIKEREFIDTTLRKSKYFGYATGRQYSMMASSTLGFIFMIGYILIRFMDGKF